MLSVAADSNLHVDGELDIYSKDRRRQTGPIELTPRVEPPRGFSIVRPETPLHSNAPAAVTPDITLSTR